MFVKVPIRRNMSGLRGFVGQRRARFPFGLGGFVGQKKATFPFGLGCACQVKTLGDDVIMVQPEPSDPGIPYSPTGLPFDGSTSIMPPDTSGGLTPAQLTKLATTPAGQLTPGVTPATLLAAASLPGAPGVVVQAAAQYKAANPVSSALSGTILGFPMIYAAGAGALFLVLLSSRKRK